MRSMTGYGRGEGMRHGFKATVELHSVNRKQLDIVVNAPREFDVLQSRIRERIQRKVSRCRISVRLALTTTEDDPIAHAHVNAPLARQCLTAFRELADPLDISATVGWDALLRIPGILTVQAGVSDSEMVWPAVGRALNQALRQWGGMREAEGAHLKADLCKRIAGLRKTLLKVIRIAPKVSQHYRDRLLRRLESAGLEGIETADERVLKEVVLFSDRSDITEELTRLESHFRQFEVHAESKKPVGRTLDFLVQEMHREVNTLGAKANDGEISQAVVVMKTELEKLREQVQNVE